MKPRPLIGVAGKARAGKDTVAGFIISYMGGYRYSFADPMRAMLKAGLGVDLTDPYWAERKDLVIPALRKSPRELMQSLGTEWGRQHVNPELWIILAHQALFNRGPGMVITDVRFENEAAWVRKHGGVVLHLERPDAVAVAPHSSENGIQKLPGDLTLENRGSLGDLQLQVKSLFV